MINMAAVPRCRSQSHSRCCTCMKNGRCIRHQCVKKGCPCVDCWLSMSKPINVRTPIQLFAHQHLSLCLI